MNATEIIKIAWPVIVIQVALQIYAIVHIVKHRNTRYIPAIAWGVIVVIGGLLGSIVYLLFGRSEGEE